MPRNLIRGFGFIELLITLVIVSVLVWKIWDSTMKPNLPEGFSGSTSVNQIESAKNRMESDIEKNQNLELVTANNQALSLENRQTQETIEYFTSGSPPDQAFQRVSSTSGQVEDLIDSIGSLRFTYYDQGGVIVSDELSDAERKSVRRIQIELTIHADQEDPKVVVNGVDLDGDPTNGKAPIFQRSFYLNYAR